MSIKNSSEVVIQKRSGGVQSFEPNTQELILEEPLDRYTNILDALPRFVNLKSLTIRRGMGSRKSLEFLEAIPKLKHLDLRFCSGDNVESFKPIARLESLERFSANDYVQKMDLDLIRSANLKSISFVAPQTAHVERLAQFVELRSVRIHGLRSPDLGLFSALSHLETLQIISGKIPSAEGVQHCSLLKELQLSMVGLQDPSAIGALESLQVLVLDRNKAIREFGFLRPLRSLEKLNLLEIPEVVSFEPLGGLPNLQFLDVWAKPLDGDVTPLLKLHSLQRLTVSPKVSKLLENARLDHNE